MKHRTFIILFALLASADVLASSLDSLVRRLQLFGERIPQEKVFVHMDNTCYFLGDTIWFAAYTCRTNNDRPSKISRILYTELWNNDGYLVERKLVNMNNGRGRGFFALPDSLYAGYYELRAYTRWQLNWGQTEHEHSWSAELWFFNRQLAKEYYRDYDKLYSRVFPVYDKPREEGRYSHDMTLRPLRRYFKNGKASPSLQLKLYPEGGNLIAATPNRVAFEVTTEEGEPVEGELAIDSIQARTVSRGRGAFVITPNANQKYKASFVSADGRQAEANLPQAETDGVAIRIGHKERGYGIMINKRGKAGGKELGLTVMREGVLCFSRHLSATSEQIVVPDSALKVGVNQLTVFDADGRIYADRLFFVSKSDQLRPTLSVHGIREQYKPFEKIELGVKREGPRREDSEEAHLSLAVRDAAHSDITYDCGNIMTEMLLASEIKGFVPQPDYFFEADDEEHRQALDLLMMTQGWRRFKWEEMAVPGNFELTHPAELTQVLEGEVYPYHRVLKEDKVFIQDLILHAIFMGMPNEMLYEQLHGQFGTSDMEMIAKMAQDNQRMADSYHDHNPRDESVNNKDGKENEEVIAPTLVYGRELSSSEQTYEQIQGRISGGEYSASRRTDAAKANEQKALSWGHPVTNLHIHAEFAQPGSETLIADMDSPTGRFKIEAPAFEGDCVMHLAASKNSTPRGNNWVVPDEDEYPEYYVRLHLPYPRFVKPYSFFQTHRRMMTSAEGGSVQFGDRVQQMKEVVIRSRHGGLRAFDATKPAYVLDAYQAFNEVVDAGLYPAWYGGVSSFVPCVARNYIGDMNQNRAYELNPRFDGHHPSFFQSDGDFNDFSHLYNLDKIYIYSDYSPRREKDERFNQANQPDVQVDFRRYPDRSRRVTYRDRRYILHGFSVCEDFYHPDYHQDPPAEGMKDYRRTLYWNPDLKLDESGEAIISFYNNSQDTHITVEANGLTSGGEVLFIEQ